MVTQEQHGGGDEDTGLEQLKGPEASSRLVLVPALKAVGVEVRRDVEVLGRGGGANPGDLGVGQWSAVRVGEAFGEDPIACRSEAVGIRVDDRVEHNLTGVR